MGLNEWLAIIGALGGLEAIKWVVNFYVNRKTNARKEDAAADSMEMRTRENRSHGLKTVLLNGIQRLTLSMLNSGRNRRKNCSLFMINMSLN